MATIPFNPNTVIRCYTTEHMKNLIAKDPDLQLRLDEYERQIQAFINPDIDGNSDGIPDNNGVPPTIPITPPLP